MNQKGATVSLILVLLPVCFAITSMVFQFDIIHLLYLLVMLVLVVRYKINKRKA